MTMTTTRASLRLSASTSVQRQRRGGEAAEVEGQREDGGNAHRCEAMRGAREAPGTFNSSAPTFPLADKT